MTPAQPEQILRIPAESGEGWCVTLKAPSWFMCLRTERAASCGAEGDLGYREAMLTRATVLASVALSALSALGTGGVMSSRPVLAQAPRGCGSMPPAAGAKGPTLTNRQDGKTVCVTVGQELHVVLAAPVPTSTPWGPVRLSKPGIVKRVPITVKPARGVRRANLLAVHSGSVELSSTRSACPPPTTGGATCLAMVLWRVTIAVGVPAGTGAYGMVSAGPTCPVEQAGHPCRPKPVLGEVQARATGGGVIGEARTSGQGFYKLALRPGTYTLEVITGGLLPRCPPTEVTVSPGKWAAADITCDTGIR